MGGFFSGWRRKVGIVTLMMALVLIGVLVRSDAAYDMAAFTAGGRQFMIQSTKGYVKWSGWSPHGDESNVWMRESLSFNSDHDFIPDRNQEKGIIIRQMAIDGHRDSASWSMSYWSMIIPLTLFSAYLILWPVKRKTARPTQNST